MRARLVVVDDEEGTRQFDLQLPAIIGRSRSTDLRVGHPLVSRHHCEVYESEGLVMVRDLGSLNGTYIGDVRLADHPVEIAPGTKFTIGPVTIEAQYESASVQSGSVQSGSVQSSDSEWSVGSPTVDAPLAEDRTDPPHGEPNPPHDDHRRRHPPRP